MRYEDRSLWLIRYDAAHECLVPIFSLDVAASVVVPRSRAEAIVVTAG